MFDATGRLRASLRRSGGAARTFTSLAAGLPANSKPPAAPLQLLSAHLPAFQLCYYPVISPLHPQANWSVVNRSRFLMEAFRSSSPNDISSFQGGSSVVPIKATALIRTHRRGGKPSLANGFHQPRPPPPKAHLKQRRVYDEACWVHGSGAKQ